MKVGQRNLAWEGATVTWKMTAITAPVMGQDSF